MPKQVTRYRKNTANPIHIFMGFITVGVWTVLVHLPLLAIRAIFRKKEVTRYAEPMAPMPPQYPYPPRYYPQQQYPPAGPGAM